MSFILLMRNKPGILQIAQGHGFPVTVRNRYAPAAASQWRLAQFTACKCRIRMNAKGAGHITKQNKRQRASARIARAFARLLQTHPNELVDAQEIVRHEEEEVKNYVAERERSVRAGARRAAVNRVPNIRTDLKCFIF